MPKDSLGGRYEIVSVLGAGGPPAFAEVIGRDLRRGSPEADFAEQLLRDSQP